MDRKQKLIQREAAKPGFKGKVNAKCIECLYDQECGSGSWRQQIEACTSHACPLYPIRPVSTHGNDDDVA